MSKHRQDLIEQVWRSSNLTWREAEKIIDDAIRVGMFMSYQEAAQMGINEAEIYGSARIA